MSYKDFSKDLKANKFQNVIVIYGKENLMMRWAVDQLRKKAGDYTVENIREFDGNVNILDAIGMAKTPSMFQPGKRVLIVRNYRWLVTKPKRKKTEDTSETTSENPMEEDEAQDMNELQKMECDALLKFAEESGSTAGNNQGPDAFLIMLIDAKYYESESKLPSFAKKLISASSSYNMDTLSRPELISFIGNRVKAAGKTMNQKQLNYLIESTGYFNKDSQYRLDDLDNDLNKIIDSCEGQEIIVKQNEDLIAGDADKNVFNLIEAMMLGDRRKVIAVVEHILAECDKSEGEAFKLIGLLTSQFEMMYDSLIMEENGISMKAMTKALGVNSYRFEKAYKAAHRFDIRRLKEYLILLYNCDRDVKSGNMSAEVALETFALNVHP